MAETTGKTAILSGNKTLLIKMLLLLMNCFMLLNAQNNIDLFHDTLFGEFNTPSMYGMQNFPNPFNPSTTIHYQLPKSSEVELSIYNLLGQKIETLISERQQSGKHQIKWDATGFPSGIYYYMIQAVEFRQVKKMVLVR